MSNKTTKNLEEITFPLELFENSDEDCVLLEPSEILILDESEPAEALDVNKKCSSVKHKTDTMKHNNISPVAAGNSVSTTRRASGNIDSRIDSVLTGLIEQRLQTKGLPLALRKRLMYQRSVSA